jgi:hypothetical protein
MTAREARLCTSCERDDRQVRLVLDGPGEHRPAKLRRIAAARASVTHRPAELQLTPDALVIPFGMTATAAIHACADAGHVDPRRCLLGLRTPAAATATGYANSHNNETSYAVP